MYRIVKIAYTDTCYIVRRANRFVVIVSVNDTLEKAYINNTGRLNEILVPERKAYCIRTKGTKTNYRLIAVRDRDLAALIDTRIQEDVFKLLLERNMISWLNNCHVVKRAPRLGQSVLDYLVKCGDKKIYVELKSAVLRGDSSYAMYPDCPSTRGRRHIRELISHVEMGGYGIILFVAALPYVEYFTPNRVADPIIANLIKVARDKGVIVKSINIVYNPNDYYVYLVNDDLPVIL